MTNPGEFTNLCVFGDTLCVCVRADTLSTGNPPIGATCPPASETQDCQDVPCPIDCQGDYGPWSDCSAECGDGEQHSAFEATQDSQNGGAACPDDKTQTCNENPCPVDCVAHYGPPGECSSSCGDGTATSALIVEVPAEAGGAACPARMKEEPCVGTGPTEYFKIGAGWPSQSYLYGPGTRHCNIESYKAGLAPGEGYYYDAGYAGGWCRTITAARVEGCINAHAIGYWTGGGCAHCATYAPSC